MPGRLRNSSSVERGASCSAASASIELADTLESSRFTGRATAVTTTASSCVLSDSDGLPASAGAAAVAASSAAYSSAGWTSASAMAVVIRRCFGGCSAFMCLSSS